MNTCSDQLRAELTANNIEMNRLTERNDAILSTLRGRGLEPVRASNEPLTQQEIHARDWFCKDGSAECRRVLLDVYDFVARPIVLTDDYVPRLNKREIIRKGNEFYYV